METAPTYTAFSGTRLIAAGTLRDVLPILKQRFDKNSAELILVFEDETGRQVDFDLRGSLAEALERADPTLSRGPGRPKLGVTSREVSLLPHHWDWLERQQSGCSASLRRLVEHAIKQSQAQGQGKERARRIRAALSPFLSSMAGDRPHYEEASRALYRGDVTKFETLVRRWPKDIREYAVQKVREAARADAGSARSLAPQAGRGADSDPLAPRGGG